MRAPTSRFRAGTFALLIEMTGTPGSGKIRSSLRLPLRLPECNAQAVWKVRPKRGGGFGDNHELLGWYRVLAGFDFLTDAPASISCDVPIAVAAHHLALFVSHVN